MSALGALWRSRSGVAAVESAFVLPLTLLMLLGIIETGRALWTQSALTFAVQEAARCASVRPAVCGDAASIAAFAAAQAPAAGIPAAAFQSAHLACGWQVTGQVQYQFMAYAAFPGAPLLHAQVCRP